MKLLREILGRGFGPFLGEPHPYLVDSNTFVGIEIELEEYAEHQRPDDFKLWAVVKDGSLRPRDTGVEFITHGPYTGVIGSEIIEALDSFNKLIEFNKENYGHLPTVSDRCSVHVHINAGDVTLPQLRKWIIVYLILEKVLFEYCGEDRYYNNYCMPLLTNIPVLQRIIDRNSNALHLNALIKTATKYDAFNMASLGQKGTIEFRHHPGCYDTARILEWVNLLLCIKKYAQHSGKDWLGILMSISGRGPEAFLKDVFGDRAQCLMYNNIYDDILDAVRDMQMVEFKQELIQSEVELLSNKDHVTDLSAFTKGKKVVKEANPFTGQNPFEIVQIDFEA